MSEDVVRRALIRAVVDWRAAAQHDLPYDAERPIPDFFTLEALAKHAGALARAIAETREDVMPIRDGLWKLLPEPQPIPMRLFCEHCHAQHVDKGHFATHPHHTHTCQFCGLTWRPAKVFTVGVQFIPGFKDTEV